MQGWRRDLALFLAIYVIVSPAASYAAGDCGSTEPSPARLLVDTLIGEVPAQSVATPREPRLTFAPVALRGELSAAFTKSDDALRAAEVFAERQRLKPNTAGLRLARASLQKVRQGIESLAEAARQDASRVPELEEALREYYARDGLLWRYASLFARQHYQRQLPEGVGDPRPLRSDASYDDLGDLYVKIHPTQIMRDLSGEWMGVLDPRNMKLGTLRYNPHIEVTLDQDAIAHWTAEDQHVWNLRLHLAFTQVKNWVNNDALDPSGGGDLPCWPDHLSNAYLSMKDPQRLVEYMRWSKADTEFRVRLAETLGPTLVTDPTFSTPKVIAAMRPTVRIPSFNRVVVNSPNGQEVFEGPMLDAIISGVYGGQEAKLAALRFNARLAQTAAPLSLMGPRALARRLAALETESRTWAALQITDKLISEFNAKNPEVRDLKLHENAQEIRERRFDALRTPSRSGDPGLMDAYLARVVERIEALELPQPRPLSRPLVQGDGLADYARAVTDTSRGLFELSEQIERVELGLPLSADIRVTPALAWILRREQFVRDYHLVDPDTKKPYFYTNDGKPLTAELDAILVGGKTPAQLRADFDALVERSSNRERKILGALRHRLALDRDELPHLLDIFPTRNAQNRPEVAGAWGEWSKLLEALQAHVQAGIDGNPLLAQRLEDYDDERLYRVLGRIVNERDVDTPLYALEWRAEELRIDPAAVRERLPGHSPGPIVREAQAIVDAARSTYRRQVAQDHAIPAGYSDELVLDRWDPVAQYILDAIRSKSGRKIFDVYGDTVMVNPYTLESVYRYRDDDDEAMRVYSQLRDMLKGTVRAHTFYRVDDSVPLGYVLRREVEDAKKAPTPRFQYRENEDGTISLIVPGESKWTAPLLRATAGSDRLRVTDHGVEVPDSDPLFNNLRGLRHQMVFRDRNDRADQVIENAIRPAQPIYRVLPDGRLAFNKPALIEALSGHTVVTSRNLRFNSAWAQEMPFDARETRQVVGENDQIGALLLDGQTEAALQILNRQRTRHELTPLTLDMYTGKDEDGRLDLMASDLDRKGWPRIEREQLRQLEIAPRRPAYPFALRRNEPQLFNPFVTLEEGRRFDPRFVFLRPPRHPRAWTDFVPTGAENAKATKYDTPFRYGPNWFGWRYEDYWEATRDFERAAADYRRLKKDSEEIIPVQDGGAASRAVALEDMLPHPDDRWDELIAELTSEEHSYFGDKHKNALLDYFHDVNADRVNPIEDYPIYSVTRTKPVEWQAANALWRLNNWLGSAQTNEGRGYRARAAEYRDRADDLYASFRRDWSELRNYGERAEASIHELDDAIDRILEVDGKWRIDDRGALGRLFGTRLSTNHARLELREYVPLLRERRDELRRRAANLAPLFERLDRVLPRDTGNWKSVGEAARIALTDAHDETERKAKAELARRGLPTWLFDQVWANAIADGSVRPHFEARSYNPPPPPPGQPRSALPVILSKTQARALNALDFAMVPSPGELRTLSRVINNRRARDAVQAPIAGPAARLAETRDALNNSTGALGPMHDEVINVLTRHIVQDALAAQKKSACDTLENIGQMDDEEKLRELVLAVGSANELLDRYQQFRGIHEAVVHDYIDYHSATEKSVHWATTIAIGVLTIAMFIPGVNIPAALGVAILLPLFGAEVYYGIQNHQVIARRLDFATDLGTTTTLTGRMVGDESIAKDLDNDLFWNDLFVAMDTAFFFMEGFRALKIARMYARGGELAARVADAEKLLKARGIVIPEGATITETSQIYRAWLASGNGASSARDAARVQRAIAIRMWKSAADTLAKRGIRVPKNAPLKDFDQTIELLQDWRHKAALAGDDVLTMPNGTQITGRELSMLLDETLDAVQIWRTATQALRHGVGGAPEIVPQPRNPRGPTTEAPIPALPPD